MISTGPVNDVTMATTLSRNSLSTEEQRGRGGDLLIWVGVPWDRIPDWTTGNVTGAPAAPSFSATRGRELLLPLLLQELQC